MQHSRGRHFPLCRWETTEIRTGTVFSVRIRQACSMTSWSISLCHTWGRASKLIHGVLGPESHVQDPDRCPGRCPARCPPPMATFPANDEQVGAPHPEPCPGVLARAVSRHSMRKSRCRLWDRGIHPGSGISARSGAHSFATAAANCRLTAA